MRYLRSLMFMVLAFIVASTASAFAFGHGRAVVVTESGINLGALMHDQVDPVYRNYNDIILRANAMAANPLLAGEKRREFLEVLDFTQTSYAKTKPYNNVLANLVTGDILTSDANPGHLPIHASLRGAYDLLIRMNQTDSLNPLVANLYTRVEQAMPAGMMGLCAYSSVIFTTVDDIKPDWSSRSTLRASIPLGGFVLAIAALNLRFRNRKRSTTAMAGPLLLGSAA